MNHTTPTPEIEPAPPSFDFAPRPNGIGIDIPSGDPFLKAIDRLGRVIWGINPQNGHAVPSTEIRCLYTRESFLEIVTAVEDRMRDVRDFYSCITDEEIDQWNYERREAHLLEQLSREYGHWQHIPGHVYVVKGQNGLHKIGVSRNVQKRVKQVGAGSSPEVAHVIASDHSFFAEAYFHQRLFAFRKEKEWFDLTDGHIAWLKTYDRFDYKGMGATE